MAGVVTGSVRRGGAGCDHRTITVNQDGKTHEFDVGEADLDAIPWGPDQERQYALWGLRRLRAQSSIALDNIVGRTVTGEEASNVRQYDFLGPGLAITKTNIGTSYVNVLPNTNGQRIFVDCTGCTQFRVIVNANFVLTGQFGVRIVRQSDNTVFCELATITAGEKEVDTDWQPMLGAFTGLELLALQAKSITASDDPIFRRTGLLVR